MTRKPRGCKKDPLNFIKSLLVYKWLMGIKERSFENSRWSIYLSSLLPLSSFGASVKFSTITAISLLKQLTPIFGSSVTYKTLNAHSTFFPPPRNLMSASLASSCRPRLISHIGDLGYCYKLQFLTDRRILQQVQMF